MELETAHIPARSRREAMDWSLALLSQGIEPVVDYIPETASWGLVVPAEEYERARETISLYQLENRRWPWRRELLQPGLLFDWGSLAWTALLVFFYWIGTRADLPSVAAMDSVAASQGQWWRVFTAVWLHADLAHLAGNAAIGFVLLGLTMARYGTGAGLLAAYLAGAGGNLLVWLLSHTRHLSLGASGMVMGALGLLAIQSLPLRLRTAASVTGFPARPSRPSKYVVTGVAGGVLLFVLLGVAPGTDVLAHAGGFVSGILLGALMRWTPRAAQNAKTNLLSGCLFVLLVLWPWWLALRHR